MATPFNEVYPLFLSQVTDYELAVMDEVALEDNLQLWLMSSIGFFSNCKHDLSDFDLSLNQFNVDLNHLEKQILSKFMVVVYLDTHLIKEDLMKQSLNSKDYRMYSPANQIKALIDLKSKINSEANTLMSRYSYNIHRLKDFFK
ncbi:hypothetical protein [Bacillus sp. FJAT-22090]|uniref:hypothetical protein n=1 Tax=Bacillus sp. FJAT-22090 TaxID=1581038 RepID=UPI0011A3CA15|nr:hypothetical protein [Bacillus sp. FJAT-22090]